jgi:hypothetical protein
MRVLKIHMKLVVLGSFVHIYIYIYIYITLSGLCVPTCPEILLCVLFACSLATRKHSVDYPRGNY